MRNATQKRRPCCVSKSELSLSELKEIVGVGLGSKSVDVESVI